MILKRSSGSPVPDKSRIPARPGTDPNCHGKSERVLGVGCDSDALPLGLARQRESKQGIAPRAWAGHTLPSPWHDPGNNRQASDVPQLTCLAVFPCRPESPHPSISAPHAKYQTFRCLYNYTNFSLTPAICTLPLLLHNFFTQDGTPEVDPGEIPTAGPSHKLHPGHTWDPAIGNGTVESSHSVKNITTVEDGKPPASDNDLSDRAVITPALSIELQVTKPRTQRRVRCGVTSRKGRGGYHTAKHRQEGSGTGPHSQNINGRAHCEGGRSIYNTIGMIWGGAGEKEHWDRVERGRWFAGKEKGEVKWVHESDYYERVWCWMIAGGMARKMAWGCSKARANVCDEAEEAWPVARRSVGSNLTLN
ncbi:hypothetical protein Bbelb_441450 [Branchiostoma belcheri]|nr:hypothetical protein Bbelb_441450 [Branchiostoma belcheri]